MVLLFDLFWVLIGLFVYLGLLFVLLILIAVVILLDLHYLIAMLFVNSYFDYSCVVYYCY